MQEYEISNNNKILGKIKIYNNINDNLNNSIIIDNKNFKKIILKNNNILQTYIV